VKCIVQQAVSVAYRRVERRDPHAQNPLLIAARGNRIALRAARVHLAHHIQDRPSDPVASRALHLLNEAEAEDSWRW